MRVRIAGVGAWGPGFTDWASLGSQFSAEADAQPREIIAPAPSCIPPRERRRAPLSVKLAVEVAQQASEMALIQPSESASVFASAMGDMQITDYMCTTLAGEAPLVSPTKFHNSVHNAPAGYWTISQGARLPSNAVSEFAFSVPASLLEAAAQCVTEDMPVLWASQDLHAPDPFLDIARIKFPCAFALQLLPEAAERGALVEFSLRPGAGTWPEFGAGPVAALYEDNPSARVLPLLRAMRSEWRDPVRLPVNRHLDLCVTRA